MLTPYNTNLPPDLRRMKEEIEGYAREYGLDFFETIFEVIDADDLNEVAAYGGFPTRYPHWSFGMQYEELRKGYDYGLSKIYEMVINNDPCYAYLMRSNHAVDQKLVMSHVYGHCLAPETRVETREGIKVITEVGVGDEVLTHTGEYRCVRVCARRWFRGLIHILRVGDPWESEACVRITAEHPVYVLRPGSNGNTELAWVPAGQIAAGDWVACPNARALSLSGSGAVEIPPETLRTPGTLLDDSFTYVSVRSVETEEYDGMVYNFSVDTDESYTLAAGMVVHNCDFFKNNAYFAHTNRKMMDEMANHGARIRRYCEKFGEDEVETFMDRCMSIDDLIDIHSTAIRRRGDSTRYDFTPEAEGDGDDVKATRFKSKDYMDDYINPREVLKKEEAERRKVKEEAARSFPEHPEKDVLLFLIENAPMKGWQRDVLSIIRDEAYYFTPQGMTKVINEGWASFWHSTMMTQKVLSPSEVIDYADHHSGTMAMSQAAAQSL